MVRETRHLWVGNLPENIREDRIREQFKRYGRVQSVKLLSGVTKEETGEISMACTVAFMDIKSASKAHNSELKIDDRTLNTEYYEPAAIPSAASPQNTPSPYSTSPAATRFPNGHGSAEEHGAPFPERFYDRSNSRVTADGEFIRRSAYPETARGRIRDRSFRNGPYNPIIDRHRPLNNSWGSSYPGETGSGRYNATGQTETGYATPQTDVVERRNSDTVAKKKTKSRSGTRSPSPSGSTTSRSPSRSRSRSSSSSSSSSTSRDTSSTGSPKSRRQANSNHQPVVHSDDKRPLAICVKNLPLRSSDTSLKDGLFHEYKKHGKVTWVKVVGVSQDRYAIVCFKKPEDVDKALEVSYDKLFFGHKIEVAPYQGYDVDDNDLRPYEAELDEFHPKATRTLFIGNLEKDVTASDLRKHFDQFGEIIEIDIKKQGVVSSYAFCQYSDIVSVVKAIRKMDGEHLGNNRVKLGFGKSMPTNCVWVDGVADNVNDKYLKMQFDPFGVINKVHVDREKGQALIFYEQVVSAQTAVNKMRGFNLKNNKIQVDFASRECQESFFEHLEKQGTVLDRSVVYEERRDSTSRSLYSRYDTPTRPRTSSYSSRSSATASQITSAIPSPGTPGSVTPRGTRSRVARFDYYEQNSDYSYRNFDEYSQGSGASHDDYETGYFAHSPLDPLDRGLQTVESMAPFAPPELRNLQKERVHLLEQLEECPSSGDELISPKKRLKLDLLENPMSEVIIEANREHRKVMEVRRLSDANLKHHSRRPSIDSGKHYLPHAVCKRRKTAGSDTSSRVHHYDHSGSESVGGSRPGTPLCDERPENFSHSEPRRTPREREGPLSLPLPRFAAQLMNRGSVSVAGIKGQKDNNVLSSPPLAVISNPRPPSPINHVPPPASPPPRPPSLSSNSSDSDGAPPSPSLEERIRSLDEKYEKWSGSRAMCTARTGETTLPTEGSLEKFRLRHKLLDLDLKEVQPSEIVKSVMAKRSVFDEDSKRLENVGEKYEPKEFVGSFPRVTNTLSTVPALQLSVTATQQPSLLSPRSSGTTIPAAKGLQYPFPSHPPTAPLTPTSISSPATTTTSTNPSATTTTTTTTTEATAPTPRPPSTAHGENRLKPCATPSENARTSSKVTVNRSIPNASEVTAKNKPSDKISNSSPKSRRNSDANSDDNVKERLEKARLENDRLEKEKAEKERVERERVEKEKQEKERLEKERLEKERLERESELEKERLQKERIEKERLEQERLEIERRKEREREERERKERDERERKERDERERKERDERERKEREREEKERREREEKERREREEKERREREDKERREREEKERREREDRERREREDKERREREDKERREREEKERREREERERRDREDKERREREEQLEKERKDKERRERKEREEHKDDNHEKRKDEHRHHGEKAERHKDNNFYDKNTKERESHSKHHIRDEERRKESIKENRDNNVHEKHRSMSTDVKEKPGIETRHLSLDIDKKSFENSLFGKRKERNNSLPANIGKRRMSSHESLDGPDDVKRFKSERRDSKDSTRSDEKVKSKHKNNSLKHDKHNNTKDKDKEREERHKSKHKLDKQKVKSKSRDKESPLTDKDFLARLDLRSTEEIEKLEKQKEKRKDSTDEKAGTPKSSDERRVQKKERIRKLTNSSSSDTHDDDDEPKKHSIFDIVDDEPAYISMYDKVKARSCKNMQKQEEEKRQEKIIKAKFSQLKQSRAKREEKKRSTSWDEDSDSDRERMEIRLKRSSKFILSSDEDSDEERIKIRNSLFKITSDTSDDDYKKTKEVFSDDDSNELKRSPTHSEKDKYKSYTTDEEITEKKERSDRKKHKKKQKRQKHSFSSEDLSNDKKRQHSKKDKKRDKFKEERDKSKKSKKKSEGKTEMKSGKVENLFGSLSEDSVKETSELSEAEYDKEREHHKRRKEKKRREKQERRLQEAAEAAAANESSMDFADMGKQLEANIKDESVDGEDIKTENETTETDVVKEERKKKKRKKSKEEKQKHHHHHHHDKPKINNVEVKVEDVKPTTEIKIEIEEVKPASMPNIVDFSPESKMSPLISPIPKTPTTSKDKKRDKLIPGFGSVIDENLHESAVKSISSEFEAVKQEPTVKEEEIKTEVSTEVTEEKPRVVISQEETEDAVAALLGESFGSGDHFEECYTEQKPTEENNPQDDEEMRQAVQSLSASDLDVKPETPQSEHELQIDTDTEEQEEIALRFDQPPKTPDITELLVPPKTPDIPSYFRNSENIVIKTGGIGSPPSLTPIKPTPILVAEVKKKLELENSAKSLPVLPDQRAEKEVKQIITPPLRQYTTPPTLTAISSKPEQPQKHTLPPRPPAPEPKRLPITTVTIPKPLQPTTTILPQAKILEPPKLVPTTEPRSQDLPKMVIQAPYPGFVQAARMVVPSSFSYLQTVPKDKVPEQIQKQAMRLTPVVNKPQPVTPSVMQAPVFMVTQSSVIQTTQPEPEPPKPAEVPPPPPPPTTTIPTPVVTEPEKPPAPPPPPPEEPKPEPTVVSVIKEVEKFDEEKADTESVISDTSKERSSADILSKDDNLDNKEDSDYWSAKEVNIDSVIKTLCSADELSDHSSDGGKDEWEDEKPEKTENVEEKQELEKKEYCKSEDEVIDEGVENEDKEVAVRGGFRGRGGRGRGRRGRVAPVDRGGIQTRRAGKLPGKEPVPTTPSTPITLQKRGTGRAGRPKNERKIHKSESEVSPPADVYEFRDDADDGNKEQRPRLILTIKSPAVTSGGNTQTAIVKEVTKDGAKEITKEAAAPEAGKEDFASPVSNTRKSKRLQERDVSRNTVDDTIEDVVRNTVQTRGQAIQNALAGTRRSSRQAIITKPETPKKSPRGGARKKDRRASEANDDSDVEKPKEEPVKALEAPKVEPEKPKEPPKKIEPVVKEVPHAGLKAEMLRRVNREQNHEPMNLIDPVTGLLTPMRECEEGKYIPLPGNGERKPGVVMPNIQPQLPPKTTVEVKQTSVITQQPQQVTVVQQPKPQSFKAHVLASQAAKAVVSQQTLPQPIQSPQPHVVVQNTLAQPITVNKAITQSGRIQPTKSPNNINVNMAMSMTITKVKTPQMSPNQATTLTPQQILQASKHQAHLSNAHLAAAMQMSNIKQLQQQVTKHQTLMTKTNAVHPLHQQQTVASPPLTKAQPTRTIQAHQSTKGIMDPPKVEVAPLGLGPRATLSPQGQPRHLPFESLGDQISHFPGLRGLSIHDIPAYMHPHMPYQILRQNYPRSPLMPGSLEKSDGQEGEEAPVTSPPLELRRVTPISVVKPMSGRNPTVPHGLHSPHDRATDSPQIGSGYSMHTARMQHYPPAHPTRYFEQAAEPPPAHRPMTSHTLVPLGSHIPPERPLSAHMPDRPLGSHLPPDRPIMHMMPERPLGGHLPITRTTFPEPLGAGLGAAGNLLDAVERHHGVDAPASQRGLQAATPPHASQVPPQADSLFALLQQYPCMWQGLLALKNDQAAVQMYFVSGNAKLAKECLPENTDGTTPPLRIFQRMRLEPPQVEGVSRKMQMQNEHCILLALPCGHDHVDVLKQSTNLNNGFIKYLQAKQAAGIVNYAAAGTTHPPAYVVHIFPSCEFVNENLRRIAPNLLERVADIAHLLIVVTTV